MQRVHRLDDDGKDEQDSPASRFERAFLTFTSHVIATWTYGNDILCGTHVSSHLRIYSECDDSSPFETDANLKGPRE